MVDDTGIALDERSKALRLLVVRGLAGGRRGHIGSSMSLIEILRVLYDDFLSIDPKNPTALDRDRLILSKGHGCLALYALLVDKGFVAEGHLDTFCHFDGIMGGHPERGKVPGVEASTGALGHGLSIAVGMALAARIQGRESKVYAVMGDGEINEGSIWEAAMSAGKHRLDTLTALVDYNKIQSAGPTKLIQDLEPLREKWTSFGFEAFEVDGHSVDDLKDVLHRAAAVRGKPSAIICHTVKGKGISFAEHEPSWHHKSNIPEDVIDAMIAELL